MNINKAKKLMKSGEVTCACCGWTSNLTIDHIVPRSKGGKSNKENINILCKPCNELKGSKIITLADLQRLRQRILLNAKKYGYTKKALLLIRS